MMADETEKLIVAEDYKQAKKMRVTAYHTCSCTHFLLFNEKGEVFAEAAVDPDTVMDIIAQLSAIAVHHGVAAKN